MNNLNKKKLNSENKIYKLEEEIKKLEFEKSSY